MNPLNQAKLNSLFSQWEANSQQKSNTSFGNNIGIMISVIVDKSFSDMELRNFISQCGIDPNKETGFSKSRAISGALKGRNYNSIKELFDSLNAQAFLNKSIHPVSNAQPSLSKSVNAPQQLHGQDMQNYMLECSEQYNKNVAEHSNESYTANAKLLVQMIENKEVSNEALVGFLRDHNLEGNIKNGIGFAKNRYIVKAIQDHRGSSSLKEFYEAVSNASQKAPPSQAQQAPLAGSNVQALQPQPAQNKFEILETIPRPSAQGPIPINVEIANCSHLSKPFTEAQLGAFFELANEYTLNQPYPCQPETSRLIEGKMVHRANHNGTHSIRQVRFLEATLDCIAKTGNPEMLNKFTDEEILHLKLAAYFMRAGRVDESEHSEDLADNYNERSAQIYEAYAKQLTQNPKIIDFTRKIIEYSCVPWGHCAKIQGNKKAQFAHSLLSTVHEMDLPRCYSAQKIADKGFLEGAKGRLRHSGISPQNVEALFNDFAVKVLHSTGAYRIDYRGKEGNSSLFADCSTSGGKCWEAVSEVPIPQWA